MGAAVDTAVGVGDGVATGVGGAVGVEVAARVVVAWAVASVRVSVCAGLGEETSVGVAWDVAGAET